MKYVSSIMAMAGIIIATAACTSPPYVHKSGQFNREAADFGKPVNNIGGVTICYSSFSATPQQVYRLAAEECTAFNKTAKFREQQYNVCPLAAPIAAVYSCIPENKNTNGYGSGQDVPGGTLMNYDGILFRY